MVKNKELGAKLIQYVKINTCISIYRKYWYSRCEFPVDFQFRKLVVVDLELDSQDSVGPNRFWCIPKIPTPSWEHFWIILMFHQISLPKQVQIWFHTFATVIMWTNACFGLSLKCSNVKAAVIRSMKFVREAPRMNMYTMNGKEETSQNAQLKR